MARQKGLTEEDLRLWAAYGRTITRYMPGSRQACPPEALKPAPPPPAAPLLVAAKPSLAKAAPELGLNSAPAGLDKSSWRNFYAGKTRVEARLDLHGHTAS